MSRLFWGNSLADFREFSRFFSVFLVYHIHDEGAQSQSSRGRRELVPRYEYVYDELDAVINTIDYLGKVQAMIREVLRNVLKTEESSSALWCGFQSLVPTF